MSSLINPKPTVQVSQDFTPEPVYLRNPETGIIFKLTHIDTIKRCQQQFYQPSSEEAMLEQAAEMYAVQGRPYPPRRPEPVTVAATASESDELPEMGETTHERNRRAGLQRGR
jgi:hypothetical protein